MTGQKYFVGIPDKNISLELLSNKNRLLVRDEKVLKVEYRDCDVTKSMSWTRGSGEAWMIRKHEIKKFQTGTIHMNDIMFWT